MKSKRITFQATFGNRTTHWVNVVIHPSRKSMRTFLTRVGHNSSHTNACCWQANKPGKDSCIAEIHLARGYLDLDTVAHESSHAAFHRSVLIGIPKEDPEFQEWVATDTGRLTQAICRELRNRHQIWILS